MSHPDDTENTVRTFLEAAGIPASTDEFEMFVAMYPDLRAAADKLYNEKWRYEEPVLQFTPLAPLRNSRGNLELNSEG